MLVTNELNNPTTVKYDEMKHTHCINLLKIFNGTREIDFSEIKNVSEIEQKIFNYIENQNIILLVSIDEIYISMLKDAISITIAEKLLDDCNSLERLVSISHEIGHYIDMKLYHDNDTEKFNMFYGYKESHMIESELIAWVNAEKMLKQFGFTEWEYFFKLMYECLTTYTNGDSERSKELIKRRYIMDKLHYEYIKAFYEDLEENKKILNYFRNEISKESN